MILKLFAFLHKTCKIVAAFLLFSIAANAKDLSNLDVMSKIEKTLIFDDATRNQINFYHNDVSKNKSDFTIDKQKENKLDIIVTKSKVDNLSIREKEKLAYNAALVDQHEVAIKLYKEVLEQEPENNYAKLALASSYQKLKQFNQAKKYYYDLLDSESSNKERIIANLLSIISQESPRESIYLINKLVKQNPKSSFILASAAMAYDRVGESENAILMLERAIITDETRLDYKYNLAIIYDKTKQYAKALKLYDLIARSDYSSYQIPISQVKERRDFIKDNYEY